MRSPAASHLPRLSLRPPHSTLSIIADEGIIQFDPRELKEEELPVIAARLQEIMGEDQEG